MLFPNRSAMSSELFQDSGSRTNETNMKADLCLPVTLYKEILKHFDFAQSFVDDPNIFNSNSSISRSFLIQAFAFIHPDFHYLSFLSKEDDQELIRAAEILQIAPINTKKSDKLFDNFNDSEIKMFWSRLFSLLNCKKDSDFYIDVIETSQEKFGFLKDISKTLDYVDHKFPVIKEKNFSNEILIKEVENWTGLHIKCSDTQENSSVLNYDTSQGEHINIEKLLMDLEQMTSVLRNTQFTNIINKPEHLEFFNSFTSLTQNIDQCVTNLKEINSSFFDELNHEMLSKAKFIQSSNFYFLKRYYNFFKTLEYKKKFS